MYEEAFKNRQLIRKNLKTYPASSELLADLALADRHVAREHARIDATYNVRYSPKFEPVIAA